MSEEHNDLGVSPIENALNTLRENPEIIGKIADAIGMAPPSDFGNASQEQSEEAEASSSDSGLPPNLLDKLPLVLSALGQGGSGGSGLGKLNLGALMGDPNKITLLKALCPYLNPARRETAEGILRLWSVGDILRKL